MNFVQGTQAILSHLLVVMDTTVKYALYSTEFF